MAEIYWIPCTSKFIIELSI